MSNAAEYADGIAAEVRTVELLAGLEVDALTDVVSAYGDDDTDALREALEASGLDVEVLDNGYVIGDDSDAATWLEDNGSELENYEDVFTAWLEGSCLEVELEGTRRLSEEWTVQRVRITRTTGGPGAFVIFDGGSSALIEVVWGSDRADRRVQAPRLAGEAMQLGD